MQQQWRAVLVHGAGGGAWEWAVWSRVLLAHDVALFAFDLKAVDAGLAATRLQDYAEQVEQCVLAAKQRDKRVVLIGASLGGLLALMNAEHADALVLINPIPPTPLHQQLPEQEWPSIVKWQSEAKFGSTYRAMPDCDALARIAAHRQWRDESGAVLNDAYAGVKCKAKSIPSLVFASSDDADIPVAVSEQLALQCKAEFRVIQNASHLGPLLGDSAANTAGQAVAWLNGLR